MVFKSILGVICTCLAVVSLNTYAATVLPFAQASLIDGGSGTLDGTANGIASTGLIVTDIRDGSSTETEVRAILEFDISDYTSISSSPVNTAIFELTTSTALNVFYPHSYSFFAYTSTANGAVALDDWDPIGKSLFGTVTSTNTGQVIQLDATTVLQGLQGTGQLYLGIMIDLVEVNNGGNQFTAASLDITTVPVPGAVWLFGSGLIGLIGVARRKKA